MEGWLDPVYDAAGMAAADRWTIEQAGVPSLDLMEAAGRGLARAAAELAGGRDRATPVGEHLLRGLSELFGGALARDGGHLGHLHEVQLRLAPREQQVAEAFAPGYGSQLWDYLNGSVVFRNLGFDPMVNVANPADLVHVLELATHGSGEGVFNAPGYDTLPLSEAARLCGRRVIQLPAPLIRPVYRLRHWATGSEFSYGIHRNQMHLGLVLDGSRAHRELGYTPTHPVDWPIGARLSHPDEHDAP